MSLFFISAIINDVNTRFILDATTKIQVVEQGKLTKHPVQDGSSVSDNYVNGNVQISFAGKVSDIKPVNSPLYYDLDRRPVNVDQKQHLLPIIDRKPYVTNFDKSRSMSSVDSFVKGLQLVKRNKTPFTIEAGEIGTFDNCFFTSLAISQDKNAGTHLTGYGNLSTVNVMFTVEQVRFGAKAEVTVIRDSLSKDLFAKQTTSAGTKQEISGQKEVDAGPTFEELYRLY